MTSLLLLAVLAADPLPEPPPPPAAEALVIPIVPARRTDVTTWTDDQLRTTRQTIWNERASLTGSIVRLSVGSTLLFSGATIAGFGYAPFFGVPMSASYAALIGAIGLAITLTGAIMTGSGLYWFQRVMRDRMTVAERAAPYDAELARRSIAVP